MDKEGQIFFQILLPCAKMPSSERRLAAAALGLSLQDSPGKSLRENRCE
jgi:hypothetical protein